MFGCCRIVEWVFEVLTLSRKHVFPSRFLASGELPKISVFFFFFFFLLFFCFFLIPSSTKSKKIGIFDTFGFFFLRETSTVPELSIHTEKRERVLF